MSDRASSSAVSSDDAYDAVYQHLVSRDVKDLAIWCREIDITMHYSSTVGHLWPTTLKVRLPNIGHAHNAAYSIKPNSLGEYEIRRAISLADPKTTRYLRLWLVSRRTVGTPPQHQRVVKRNRDNTMVTNLYTRSSNRWRWFMQQSAEIRDYLVQLVNAATHRPVNTFIELEFTGYEMLYVETPEGPMLELPDHSHPDTVIHHPEFYVELAPLHCVAEYPLGHEPKPIFANVIYADPGACPGVRRVKVCVGKAIVEMNFDAESRVFTEIHTALHDRPNKYRAISPYYIDIPEDINNGN